MHTNYKCESIRDLREQQARFAPRTRKIEQVDQAERLLHDITDDRSYNFEFVCFRITGFRPNDTPVVKISPADLRHDLLHFIEDLSESANVSADEFNQPVYTVEDLAKKFNVSSKTISRWRQQGLVSRKFIFDSKRSRIGFLHTSVDRFTKENSDKIKRGKRFSKLTQTDRDDIIERARRFMRAGGCPPEISRRIAKHMDRSVETIRHAVRKFDSENPEISVFALRTGLLNLEMKERIYADFMAGKTAESISKRYCRTRTTIYRVINEIRAKQIMELPLDYMDSVEFHRKNAAIKIVDTDMPAPETKTRRTKAPAGLPHYLASLYDTPLLTREQEQHLFRKYNYLKLQASKLRAELNPARASTTVMDQIDELYGQAVKIKNRIVQSNLRLVVSIAKRHVDSSEDFFQLVSDGNMSLIRAAEKFDYYRGNKFSTYASWAIMKNFARTIPGEFKQRDRFRPTSEDLFLAREDQRTDRYLLESAQQIREQQVNRILESLDEREQQIIVSRFGLDHAIEPLTLREVGQEMGVTKERIRQIQTRAMDKLRQAAEEDSIELLEEILNADDN